MKLEQVGIFIGVKARIYFRPLSLSRDRPIYVIFTLNLRNSKSQDAICHSPAACFFTLSRLRQEKVSPIWRPALLYILSKLNKYRVLLSVIKKMHHHVLLLVAVHLYVFYFLSGACSFKFDVVDRFAIAIMNIKGFPGSGQARLET